MSILIDKDSRILIQGITGSTGRSYAERMIANHTPLVGGISPGKSGQTVAGVPVFDTAACAIAATDADCVLSTVGNADALEAMYEVLDAGVRLVVLYTENVPIHDALRMCAYAKARGAWLLGPNSAGVITPGKANVADIADSCTRPGRIGVVSKSGTLTYEIMDGIHEHGLGESSVVCLGGDPIVGTGFADVLALFERDPETDAVVLVGEPGGDMEYRAADVIRSMRKPVVTYVAGRYAPSEKRMGHAGAVSGASGNTSAAAKAEALAEAGAFSVPVVTEVGSALAGLLARAR